MNDIDFDKLSSIVVIKPCCNRVVYIAINHPEVIGDDEKQEIGDMVANGCRVEHWTREEVKTRNWEMGCTCQNK